MAERPEERLLCLLNHARLRPPEEAEARALAAAGLGWESVYELAELNAVTVLVDARIRSLGLDGAGALRARPKDWDDSVAKVRRRGMSRWEWSKALLETLSRAGVDTVVLKGGLFGPALYGDPAYKKMNDLDILVRREQAEAAAGVLRRLAFRSVGGLFGREEISDKSHHSPPFVSQDLACVVGLHWGLQPPHAPRRQDAGGIWSRVSPVEVGGARALRMSWEDNLVHLCIHLPYLKTGLRELADVSNLCRLASPAIDWAKVDALVREARAEGPAYRVIRLARALIPFDCPEERLAAWRARAGRFWTEDTDRRAADPAALLRSRSTHVGKIEKAYAVFKLSDRYSERVGAWLKMWALLLWPKAEELRRIAGVSAFAGTLDRLRWRLRAPGILWRAMAVDHGSAALALLTVYNAWSVLRDTALRPFRKDGPSIRSHPAVKLLEVLE